MLVVLGALAPLTRALVLRLPGCGLDRCYHGVFLVAEGKASVRGGGGASCHAGVSSKGDNLRETLPRSQCLFTQAGTCHLVGKGLAKDRGHRRYVGQGWRLV